MKIIKTTPTELTLDKMTCDNLVHNMYMFGISCTDTHTISHASLMPSQGLEKFQYCGFLWVDLPQGASVWALVYSYNHPLARETLSKGWRSKILSVIFKKFEDVIIGK